MSFGQAIPKAEEATKWCLLFRDQQYDHQQQNTEDYNASNSGTGGFRGLLFPEIRAAPNAILLIIFRYHSAAIRTDKRIFL